MASDTGIAATPPPPYYAVIFTSTRTPGDDGYGAMAARMMKMAAEQPGFLGVETAHDAIGITVSYWRSLEDIADWKRVAEHREAQRNGREKWYAAFKTRIAKVERDNGFER